MDALRFAGSLDAAIEGTARGRFLHELYSNSAVLPIAIVLLEVLLEGGAQYFLKADFYAITFGAFAQAACLSRTSEAARLRRIAGNLIAPAIYTAFELATEGAAFFLAPHHIAYWSFALAIGLLQGARGGARNLAADTLVVLENVVRSMFLFAIYYVFELLSASPSATARPFLADPSHVFIGWAIALLGLAGGVAAVGGQRYLAMLRTLSRRLRLYSEWLFGRALLEEAVSDPERLSLKRCERAILFMDLRGFTAWSEAQAPESVVAVLNGDCAVAESVFARSAPIRCKFSADEVMAVFARPQDAIAAARNLAREVGAYLKPHGLGVGIGLHWGPVVEGLMGGTGTKQFDVIGDTVNTAKRIEGAAGPGEILFSEDFRAAAGLAAAGRRTIEVKGKAAPLVVHLAPLDCDQAVPGPIGGTLIP